MTLVLFLPFYSTFGSFSILNKRPSAFLIIFELETLIKCFSTYTAHSVINFFFILFYSFLKIYVRDINRIKTWLLRCWFTSSDLFLIDGRKEKRLEDSPANSPFSIMFLCLFKSVPLKSLESLISGANKKTLISYLTHVKEGLIIVSYDHDETNCLVPT